MADALPGWNAYAYVLNDPMGFLDPTGLSPCGVDDKDICQLPEVVVTADRDAEPMLLPWNPGLSLGQNLTNLFYNRDGFELAMDAAGIADPTGLVDLSASLYYIARGDALNAGISLASILPFGDLLKSGRMGAKIAKGVGTYTRSSLQLGQQMHKMYKTGANGLKEFRLPSGRRIDFIDLENGIIYELKPFNPRAMQQGQRQLDMYVKELQTMPRFKGMNWKTILDTY